MRELLDEASFIAGVNRALERGTERIPLLLLRSQEFAQRAWREGKRPARRLERATVRAFKDAAVRAMREGDLFAHEGQSDWFCIAMSSPSRGDAGFATVHVRAALERISATMAVETGRRMESGWCSIECPLSVEAFDAARGRALERGARERERYEFLATVGHELRTPLTSIRGYIETLLDDDVDPPTARRFLETARAEAFRLTRLVDGILDFSLLDLHAPAPLHACDVASVARGAVEAILPIAIAADVRLEIHGDGEGSYARIESDACMHLLLNLLENGVKYARHRGRVVLTLVRQGAFLCITVDDDGNGIPTEDRERIFCYGIRGRVPLRVAGRGVGLAIVRTIVERSRGRVRVEASPLGGARFSIDLPTTEA